jgi:hypothetical protein
VVLTDFGCAMPICEGDLSVRHSGGGLPGNLVHRAPEMVRAAASRPTTMATPARWRGRCSSSSRCSPPACRRPEPAA